MAVGEYPRWDVLVTESADYVVVGAGSAGCVLANRLSADGKHRVALLEAGGSDRRFWLRVPIGYGRTFFDPRVNWMYQTEPDPGLAGRSSYWPRGRVLGGSGSINAMVYVRGQPRDYDDWAAAGNPGWAWQDVLPWFRRLEDHELGATEQRGVGGPVRISDVRSEVHPVCTPFLEGCRQLGVPVANDINSGADARAGIYPITRRRGMRESPATAYLHPARGRSNLDVTCGARVVAVVIQDGRAVAVDYVRRGHRRRLRARREVLLCAGAIGSPQLLQISGVGPAELAERNGIEIIQDLPGVGENMQDHLSVDFLYRARRPTLNNQLCSWHGKLRQGLRYVLRRRGPLALSINQAGGFVCSRADIAEPDLQLYFSPLSYTRAPAGQRPLMNPDSFPGFLLGYSACRPSSRGRVQIRSADPRDPPLIKPCYLTTTGDAETMLAGMHFIRQLAATPALRDLIEAELRPGQAVCSEDEMSEFVRQTATTVFHPTSTCMMGPSASPATVVDARLRVHGVAGLRVIDASVFPSVPSGNTNAPVMMVAERGAEFVLADAE